MVESTGEDGDTREVGRRKACCPGAGAAPSARLRTGPRASVHVTPDRGYRHPDVWRVPCHGKRG